MISGDDATSISGDAAPAHPGDHASVTPGVNALAIPDDEASQPVVISTLNVIRPKSYMRCCDGTTIPPFRVWLYSSRILAIPRFIVTGGEKTWRLRSGVPGLKTIKLRNRTRCFLQPGQIVYK